MPGHAEDSQQIAVIIEQYRRGFATLDVAALTSIWDQEYDRIIYIAQEMAEPVQGWAGVERYYQRVASFLERVETMEVSDVSVDVLGEVAYICLSFHFEGEANRRPYIADGRVTFLLRRTHETWKAIHYHESRPGDRLSEA